MNKQNLSGQVFAVMGNPIQHSLSPWIHQYFAQHTGIELLYEKIQPDPETFAIQVQEFFIKGGKGLNITAPFKEQAFALAQKHTQRSSEAGAANTLWMGETLCADNTDGVGLVKDLSQYLQLRGAAIAIVGAGGAARSILGPLLASKPEKILLLNRTESRMNAIQNRFPEIDTCLISEFKAEKEPFDLLIHATSASLHASSLHLPSELFHPETFCYDLSYNLHQPVPFVKLAHENGCRAVDGLGMLIEQAAEAFRVWHGVQLNMDMSALRKALKNALEK